MFVLSDDHATTSVVFVGVGFWCRVGGGVGVAVGVGVAFGVAFGVGVHHLTQTGDDELLLVLVLVPDAVRVEVEVPVEVEGGSGPITEGVTT